LIKSQELADPTSCLNKAQPDEPLFVLRGHDRLASMTVRDWAFRLESLVTTGVIPDTEAIRAKITEARKAAEAMEAWPDRKWPD
jgi:hypothetical protein